MRSRCRQSAGPVLLGLSSLPVPSGSPSHACGRVTWFPVSMTRFHCLPRVRKRSCGWLSASGPRASVLVARAPLKVLGVIFFKNVDHKSPRNFLCVSAMPTRQARPTRALFSAAGGVRKIAEMIWVGKWPAHPHRHLQKQIIGAAHATDEKRKRAQSCKGAEMQGHKVAGPPDSFRGHAQGCTGDKSTCAVVCQLVTNRWCLSPTSIQKFRVKHKYYHFWNVCGILTHSYSCFDFEIPYDV